MPGLRVGLVPQSHGDHPVWDVLASKGDSGLRLPCVDLVRERLDGAVDVPHGGERTQIPLPAPVLLRRDVLARLDDGLDGPRREQV